MTAAFTPDGELLDQVFADNKGDDGDRFLKQFLARRAWADDQDVPAGPPQDQVLDLPVARPCTSFLALMVSILNDGHCRRRMTWKKMKIILNAQTNLRRLTTSDSRHSCAMTQTLNDWAACHSSEGRLIMLTGCLTELPDGESRCVQEPGAGKILTYSRGVEGLIRKSDDRRKAARKRRADRLEQAAQEQQAELKRLKNLKRAELKSQLATLKRVSGHQQSSALSKIMQGDYDPEAYDAAMAAAFDEEYYEASCTDSLTAQCSNALVFR